MNVLTVSTPVARNSFAATRVTSPISLPPFTRRKSLVALKCALNGLDVPATSDGAGGTSDGGDGVGGRNGGSDKITSSDEEDDSDFEEVYTGWNPFKKLAHGMRSRMSADPDFLFKLFVECFIDAAIILAVNYAARGEAFLSEIEFVMCQVLVSCSNDFALVYLLAPILARSRIPPAGLGRILHSLPPHVFANGRYTIDKRFGCFCFKVVQYGMVGLTMGFIGSALVNTMTDIRELTDEDFTPPAEAPTPILTGLGWLFFMGLNSNVRYNLVSAAEQTLYARLPGVGSKIGSIGLRLANNFAGAYQWVELADEMGVSQPRKSLREVARLRARELNGPRWMWWRKQHEPESWWVSFYRSRRDLLISH